MAGEVPYMEADLSLSVNRHLEDEASSACESYAAQAPYRNLSHNKKFFEVLDQMRNTKQLCDVILSAGKTDITAHRAVLAARSKYFFAMFTNEMMSESQQKKVILKEIDPRALVLLVDFMYSSEIFITEDNVQMLLPAAGLLQLMDVRNACCDFLQNQLHPSNSLGIRAFADLHGCRDLLSYAQSYTEKHFSDVVQGEEFTNLTVEQVADIVSSDQLTTSSEEQVYEAVVSWVKSNVAEREMYVSTLMQHIRLPLLSRDYLVQDVDQESLMMKSSECKDFIIEALKYHLLSSDCRAQIKTPRTKPRTPTGVTKVMYVVGGQAPKAIKSVEVYDFSTDAWQVVSELQSRRCRAGVSVLNNLIYAVGGFNGSLRVRTVDIYDSSSDTWTSAPNMEARRSTLGSAVLNGVIYAVGGFDGSTGLCSVESFDPKGQEWSAVANMTTRRSSVGVGVLGSKLYAVGGYDGSSRQCLSSVERFDGKEWKLVSHMNTRRSGAGVGVLDGKLYAVGGHDGPLVRKSVEVYDPDTDTWTLVKDMCYCRRNAGIASINGLLYVVGGDDGAANLHSVEFYCPKKDTWTMLPSCMMQGRSYAGVAVIDRPSRLDIIDESVR